MTIACDAGFLLLLADAEDEVWAAYAALLKCEHPIRPASCAPA
jgi:hypothetical protein